MSSDEFYVNLSNQIENAFETKNITYLKSVELTLTEKLLLGDSDVFFTQVILDHREKCRAYILYLEREGKLF